MSKQQNHFDFQLSQPIKYAHAGQEVESTHIQFTSPSKKQMEHNVILKEAFFKAVRDASQYAEGKQQDDIGEISGDDVMAMLYMTEGLDMYKILLSATQLFLSGVARIGGEESLTQPLIDEICQDDLEKMTGEYLVNFTIASFLQSQKKSKGTS